VASRMRLILSTGFKCVSPYEDKLN
jgi:hypothetical protein